uniref:Aldedh domain-containing protein n=1 Tax=Heligmosomoides polygyrus TaxID=6339 RepID=A0A8L8KAM6_HELPZ
LARFKKIVYRGYAEMVYSDLLEALDSERAIIRYAGDKHSRGATWAKDFIERYSAAKGKRVLRKKSNPPEYEIEIVPLLENLESGTVQCTAVRRIIVTRCPSSVLALSLLAEMFMSFVVENLLE